METSRLILSALTLNDTSFIFELLSTPLWINFIGDRNIKTEDDAAAYIQKIVDSPTTNYWVVKLKQQSTAVGIVTFMKRDYLDYYDIGYAFLPQFAKQGYAYEATKKLLDEMKPRHKRIVATVLKENESSIKLLQKLGMNFEREMEINAEFLQLYSTPE
jgi:RimJ/RimL family protein N-acetyltransferase